MGLRGFSSTSRSSFRQLQRSSAAATAATSSSSASFAAPLLARTISSTSCRLEGGGWFDKIKGVFTRKKEADPSKQTFSLIDFANQMDTARKLGSVKQFVVGRCSETTIAVEFEKQSAILRYLGSIDSTGEAISSDWKTIEEEEIEVFVKLFKAIALTTLNMESKEKLHSVQNLQSHQKQAAAKHCNCTVTEVENALSKYLWAKGAQKKIENLKEEGKPMPKTFSEVQKLMGSTPLDLARSNSPKSGQLGRNAPCPCGSKLKYKRCCGKGKFAA